MKCTVWGLQSITMEYLCMMTDGNQTYHSDHFEMYRNIESLCCVPGTNIVLQISYTSKTNKQTHRKRDEICGYQRWGMGEEELDEGSNRYSLPVTR